MVISGILTKLDPRWYQITNGIYRPWLPSEASAMTYVIYIVRIDNLWKPIRFNKNANLNSSRKLLKNPTSWVWISRCISTVNIIILCVLGLTLNDAGGGGVKMTCWSGDRLPFLKGSCNGHKNSWLLYP